MPADTDPALTAALKLRDQGKHVHLVSGGENRCLSQHCTTRPAA